MMMFRLPAASGKRAGNEERNRLKTLIPPEPGFLAVNVCVRDAEKLNPDALDQEITWFQPSQATTLVQSSHSNVL